MKQLDEAGARNSAADQKRIQTVHDHAVDLGANCKAIAESLREAAGVLRQDESMSAKMDAIQKACAAKLTPNREYSCYIRDLFEQDVVVSCDGELFSMPYTIDMASGDPVVTLGDPTEVAVAYVPAATEAMESLRGTKGALIREHKAAPAAESFTGDLVPLVEKAVRADGTIPIKVIAPGEGSSGYYPAEVLERDGPKVFTKGMHMYADHPTPTEEAERPERSVKDLVATLTGNARYLEAGPSGPGLYADAQVTAPWRPFIEEAAPHIGVSIRAMGHTESGKVGNYTGPIIKSLVAAKSIDFVTQAGAGGKILQLYEAARGRQTNQGAQSNMDEKEVKALQESAAATLAENARLKEALLLRESRDFVIAKLPKDLPELTRTRLIESLAKNPPLKDGKIDEPAFQTQITEAAKNEIEYLAKATGSGDIRGMGESTASGTDLADAQKRLDESFKGLGMPDKVAAIAAQGRK